MSAVSQAAAPAIGMLKSIVTFLIVGGLVYLGTVFYLKGKIEDRKTFVMYKNLLWLAFMAISGLYIFFKATR